MGMNAQNTDLFDAVNTGVRWLWATKGNAGASDKNRHVDPDYPCHPHPIPASASTARQTAGSSAPSPIR